MRFRALLVAQLVKNPPAMQKTLVPFLGWEYTLEKGRLTTSVFLDFLVAQLVKNPPAMRETWIRSLSGEDPLEQEMATHSSSLAWRIPWTEERWATIQCHEELGTTEET